MEPNQAYTLLWTYFAGQATTLQKQLLAEWLLDERNHEVYFRTLHDWEKAHPQILPDVTDDWQRLQPRLQHAPSISSHIDEPAVRPMPNSRSVRWWLMAASVAVLTLVGWVQKDALLYRTYSTQFGETQSINLPDGSRVVLNANSSLRFPRFLSLLPTREARLRGEAEFSVVHTVDNRPFVVHTPDQLEIRVLGTEFIVYSRERGSKVVLNRGKVALRSLKTKAKPLDIRPGEVVTMDTKGQFQVFKNQPVADHVAWKTHRFVFNRTPLSEIASHIEERFGVKIAIPDPTLAAQQVSGNYPAQTADDVVTMLGQLLDLQVEERDSVIVLSPHRRFD